MYAVYRYIDINDNRVKYIGIIHEQKRTLKERVLEHFKKDVWSHGHFRIDYIELSNRTDAEFFESHFISFYETYKYFNIAKSNWGKSDYIPQNKYKWKTFTVYDNDLTPTNIDNKLYNHTLLEKKSSIWQSTDGKWYTYVPDVNNKRKLVKRTTKEKLIEFLQDFYLSYYEEEINVSEIIVSKKEC